MSSIKISEFSSIASSTPPFVSDGDLFMVSKNNGDTTYTSYNVPFSLIREKYKTIFIPSSQMYTRSNNGCSIGSYETPTNKVHIETLDFDPDLIQYAQFDMIMPEIWDYGMLKAKFSWTADTGSGVVYWNIQSQAIASGSPLDSSWGTAVEAHQTLGTLLNNHLTGATGAMTVSGSPAIGNNINFQVYRDATNVNDTFTGNARLIGVWIQYAVSGIAGAW